jgi:hypothetical protein
MATVTSKTSRIGAVGGGAAVVEDNSVNFQPPHQSNTFSPTKKTKTRLAEIQIGRGRAFFRLSFFLGR